jgi:hypothetical protein
MHGKHARPVRRGTEGKGLITRHLASRLPYNIRKEALRLLTDVPVVASSEREIACGAESSGSDDE